MTRISKILLAMTIPSMAIGLGWFVGHSHQSPYPMLARRILIDTPNDPLINFAPLRESIEKYKLENGLEGSIYFEYLPTGTSIRIAGDDELVASSLMIIPTVMDLYKASEDGKINLDDEIAIRADWVNDKYGKLYEKGAGYKISYRDAAKLALAASDSTAYSVVKDTVARTAPNESRSLQALDVSYNTNNSQEVIISARSYTSFIKCLYFSCHLNFEHSHEILSYLTESQPANRLRDAIPNDIKVAHKSGAFSDIVQSDCGIIYIDKRNYTLCILLAGDPSGNDHHIAYISKMTYEYVAGRR